LRFRTHRNVKPFLMEMTIRNGANRESRPAHGAAWQP
jgi:hypothetical protein